MLPSRGPPYWGRLEEGEVKRKMAINLMQASMAMHQSPRCKAKSKRTGQRCRSPAVRGWSVCRMHGARGGAPTGKAHGRYKHGGFTKDIIEALRMVRALAQLVRE